MDVVGNTVLVEHGILQEQSDIRAHVGVLAKTVFVFPTASGIEAIERGRYRLREARQGDIITAHGYCVPIGDINRLKQIEIPDRLFKAVRFSKEDSLTKKGEKAVAVVRWLLRAGLFPLWAEPTIIDDVDMQISGLDISVKMSARIQVKCDYDAGPRSAHPDCTGNLFLQVKECNPYRMH